jgi:hypothetical protein
MEKQWELTPVENTSRIVELMATPDRAIGIAGYKMAPSSQSIPIMAPSRRPLASSRDNDIIVYGMVVSLA